VDRTLPQLLRKQDARKSLKISLPFLETLIRRREIDVVRLSRRCVRVPASEIRRLIEEKTVTRGSRG